MIKTIAKAAGNLSIWWLKNGHKVLVVGGEVGAGVGAIFAGYGGWKARSRLQEAALEMDKVTNNENISGEEKDRRLKKIRDKAFADICKCFAPAVVTEVLSLVSIGVGYSKLSKKHAALAVAFTSLEETYRNYRQRVADKIGAEEERNLALGQHLEEVVGEDGNVSYKAVVDGPNLSCYAVLFDEYCPNWKPDVRENLLFLSGLERAHNADFLAKGHFMLYKTHEDIGLNQTPFTICGAGWSVKRGDKCISYGLEKYLDPNSPDFMNHGDPNIWIEPNVCGCIADDIMELENSYGPQGQFSLEKGDWL